MRVTDQQPIIDLIRDRWDAVDERYRSFFEARGDQPDCVDCHKAHCCRQLVLSTEQEARLILDRVRGWSPRKRQALERRLKALPREARENFSDPCPFLVDERCQVYDVRPLACRAFHSTSKSRCKRRIKSPVPELFSELSDINRTLRERLAREGGEAKVVVTAIWMKYHWND